MRLIEGIVMVAIGPTAVERDVACLGGDAACLGGPLFVRDGRRWVDPRSTGRVGQMRVVQGLRLGAMELVGTSASAADRGGRISSPVHALGPESDGDGVRHRRGAGAAQRRGAEAAALEGARCVALGRSKRGCDVVLPRGRLGQVQNECHGLSPLTRTLYVLGW